MEGEGGREGGRDGRRSTAGVNDHLCSNRCERVLPITQTIKKKRRSIAGVNDNLCSN
jgi:hypothetical protein